MKCKTTAGGRKNTPVTKGMNQLPGVLKMQLKRHAVNPNLTIYNDSTYLGLPLMVAKGPFVIEYLERLHQTITNAIGQYPRVFAFRFDLRLPADYCVAHGSEIVTRFIESLKAKIRHNRKLASRQNKYAHDSVIRYVWTREIGEGSGRPHYHFAILLNYDAFCAIGKFESGRDNMFNRLQEAWASALGLPVDAVAGLVEIPENPRYQINLSDNDSFARFFHRASYLCKAATKTFGNGHHGFDTSRI